MKDLLTSLRLLVLSLIACCLVYPIFVLAFATTAVPAKSEGSLVVDEGGAVIGSRLLAQRFSQQKYFWPRPSAVDYDAGAAGGSNLSPTNPIITERARRLLKQYKLEPTEKLPADLVTASGSGLDPHITFSAAQAQVNRVASARGLSREVVLSLIEKHCDSPALVAFGEKPMINVLELNISLDHYRTID